MQRLLAVGQLKAVGKAGGEVTGMGFCEWPGVLYKNRAQRWVWRVKKICVAKRAASVQIEHVRKLRKLDQKLYGTNRH
jgi:hypothetical protein